MNTTPARIRSLTFVCLFLFAFLAAPFSARADEVEGTILSVGLGGSLGTVDMPAEGARPAIAGRVGTYRAGTWVPVLVKLTNNTNEPKKLHLTTQNEDLDYDRLDSVSQTEIVAPHESRNVWLYYWPSPLDTGIGITSVGIRDEDRGGKLIAKARIPYLNENTALQPNEITALFPADVRFPAPFHESPASWRFVVTLSKSNDLGVSSLKGAKGGVTSIYPVTVNSGSNFPTKAIGLDGVDVVIWNTNEIRVSDIPVGFQRKALIDWVRAGGHLIVVTGQTSWQELKELDDILPATREDFKPVASRENLEALLKPFTRVQLGILNTGVSLESERPEYAFKLPADDLWQLICKPKPGATAIYAPDPEAPPLAVSQPLGTGVITLLAFDPGTLLDLRLKDAKIQSTAWQAFWSRVGNFRGATVSDAVSQWTERNHNRYLANPPALANAGVTLPAALDVQSVTQVRLLVAVLFLIIYWVVAGPGGHAVLKAYKKVYWSWWIFGAVVVGAAIIGSAAAYFLRVTTQFVRHRTFITGTIGSTEVNAVSYYGVITPSTGTVAFSLQNTEGEQYIAPLYPFNKELSGFPPRTYETLNANPGTLEVPFRRTLKRLQSRWTGDMEKPLISGSLKRVKLYDITKLPFEMNLTNTSGRPLLNVVIAYLQEEQTEDPIQVAEIAKITDLWRPGETLTGDAGNSKFYLGDIVFSAANDSRPELNNMMLPAADRNSTALSNWGKYSAYRDEMLSLFAESIIARPPIAPSSPAITQFNFHANRPYTRTVDRTNTLRTMGAVLIAQIGSDFEDGADSDFLPLKVDGKDAVSKGKSIIAIGIPLPQVPKLKPKPATSTKPATRPATLPATRN